MKLVRMLSRVALLSLAAAVFVGLTRAYGRSARPPLPDPQYQAFHEHRHSAPQVSYFPEFFGECIVFAIFAVGGRIVLRLRLTPVSRSEGRPISLGLRRDGQGHQIMTDPQVGPQDSAVDPS